MATPAFCFALNCHRKRREYIDKLNDIPPVHPPFERSYATFDMTSFDPSNPQLQP